MKLRRVVVTGIGTINPLGDCVEEYFANLEAGVSGAAPITNFDASNFKVRFACEVKNYDWSRYFDRKEVRKYDRFAQFALVAASEAVADAQLGDDVNRRRGGGVWSSGVGGIETYFNECMDYAKGGELPRFSPFFVPRMIADLAAGHIAMKYGFMGPNYSVTSACASSNHALIDAFTLIRLGKADMVVTGGSEAPIIQAGVGGFSSMQALSTRNDDPEHASRPFDKDRDGFVMGEGAGALVLEEYEHAVKRGAKIYCEVAGGGMSADAYHMTAPHPEGAGAILSMQEALDDAGIANVNIARATCSKLEEYRSEARRQAIRNAKTRAEELATAIGQSIGACYEINDYSNSQPVVYRANMLAKSAMADSITEESAEPEVEFKPIEINYSVSAKFVLKE